MSKLSILDELIQRYHQLKYHQKSALKQRLTDVQQWQKQRLQSTHHALFHQPKNQRMASYFVTRLYGSPDFDTLASQIERMIQHAHRVEALIPATAIQTGTHAISLAILAVELDEQIAQALLHHYPAKLTISNEMIEACYKELDQHAKRQQQLDMTDQLGQYLDQYLRSRLLHTAFKIAKPLAYKHRFNTAYDFIAEGFNALKPMTSAQDFVQNFTAQERQVLMQIQRGKKNPFQIQTD
ncbi:hypothetical protein I2F27_02710 [Acinetobacter sp. B5B]|uniref:FFLEELY motif protein n=1 Tax=Acinetobacter baretiae TaxID=2605383 RepID=UPI0018C1DE4F|nr:hypothetical protein [Acinetobacter baretiae]MBF7682243.1 hypothetical protein [Acinetobacter baretiae]MBF7685071.1 hypothetical protein [Acinetobacter baretiae]